MEKYLGRILISLFVLLLVLPSSAIGGAFPSFELLKEGGVSLEPGNMRVGRIQLHPGFAFESKYDSNIFNEADKSFSVATTPEGRTDDFVFTNKPSMGITLDRAPGEVLGFDFGYLGRDEHFLEEGGSQDFFNHKFNGAVNLGGPGGRGDVTVGSSWEKAAGGSNRDINSILGPRQSNITVRNFVDASYSLSKLFKLQVLGEMEDSKFQGAKLQNVDEYNLGGSVFWQATTPVAFGVKYNHRIRHYETPNPANDNSIADQVYLAMRWVPTALVSGEIAVGYDTKRYDTFKGDNNQNLVYQVNMLYQPVKRTDITLRASREIVDSTFSTIQAFVLTSTGFGITQRLGKKVSAYADVLYENLDYQRSAPDGANGGVKTRVDDQIAGTVGLRYEIRKWLEARAGYLYEENISNFDALDYQKHVGSLEIAAKY
jgi:putative beta-barrel porin BBP2